MTPQKAPHTEKEDDSKSTLEKEDNRNGDNRKEDDLKGIRKDDTNTTNHQPAQDQGILTPGTESRTSPSPWLRDGQGSPRLRGTTSRLPQTLAHHDNGARRVKEMESRVEKDNHSPLHCMNEDNTIGKYFGKTTPQLRRVNDKELGPSIKDNTAQKVKNNKNTRKKKTTTLPPIPSSGKITNYFSKKVGEPSMKNDCVLVGGRCDKHNRNLIRSFKLKKMSVVGKDGMVTWVTREVTCLVCPVVAPSRESSKGRAMDNTSESVGTNRKRGKFEFSESCVDQPQSQYPSSEG